jgi:hypothetical protein
VNACGEHVNPESTCTIRLCLWKQESPDFSQGRVQRLKDFFMKKLLFMLSLLFIQPVFADENWSKSSSKDETGKEYQLYTLFSQNKDKEGNQTALMLISPKDNIFSKIGFVKTSGSIDCPNFCQYYVQFDNNAAKYTFSAENNAIKLDNNQKDDFLKNLKTSKELTLSLGKQRYFFNTISPNWSYTDEVKK